jgi:hypothetical protein
MRETPYSIIQTFQIVFLLLYLILKPGEVHKFLAELAKSKHRDGSLRKRLELLKGRFKIGKIQKIEMSPFQDASGLKIFDFSKPTINQLINQGEQDAMSISLSEK